MDLTPDIIDEEGKGILFARIASKLLNEGNIDQATFISEVGIKKFPNYAQGHYILGKCYQDKDMYEEARAEYERVLRYDSSHLGAMKELAGLYHSTGLEDVYKDYLYRLLTLDPLNSKILDECREKGVYEIWKSQDQPSFEPIEDFGAGELENQATDLQKDDENVEENVDSEKIDTEDIHKIDLTQFENQNDDFTTIMDGLIQESSEEGQDVDATNYLEDLESPTEIESELLAEEKPIEEHIDNLDAFENDEILEDAKSSYLEFDYSQEKNEQKDEKDESEDSFGIENEEENIQLQEEIKKEPEEVENAFDEPKTRVEDIEVKDDALPSNAHDKTELIFEKSEKNVEIQFDEEKEEGIREEIGTKIEPDTVAEVSDDKVAKDETTELASDPKIEEENEQADKSPYVKQKIISQTLGEILVSQNKYKEAKEVFLALKDQQPGNPSIDKKLEILNKIIALEEKKQ